MAVKPTEKIWHNGKLIDWDQAKIHVMSHVVNYGSSVFEGVRCYELPTGPAIFRAHDHIQRLLDSAKIYRIPVALYPRATGGCDGGNVGANRVWPCYVRPLIIRGYGEIGVNPIGLPTESYIANYAWGKYLGGTEDVGVDVCVSSWTRLAPNTLPSMAKAGANYMNSQLIKMEAVLNGYAEGIALDGRLRQRRLGRESLRGARRQDANAAAGRLGAGRHHARLGAAACARPRHPGGGADHSARNALHRRRSFLLRHRRRDHADPLGR